MFNISHDNGYNAIIHYRHEDGKCTTYYTGERHLCKNTLVASCMILNTGGGMELYDVQAPSNNVLLASGGYYLLLDVFTMHGPVEAPPPPSAN
ncbi:hypothetical protein OESDEN_04975 [Oesophagostomum dentatum]|uniref:Uncharacterized protein n=1 Tax=Oesophagostomum dentatum TaxID=61180 RepID=A0A0B1TI65_OESDE|nr:hypothetical protein OESDEN_04975 [Oesophagostomum dentatum]